MYIPNINVPGGNGDQGGGQGGQQGGSQDERDDGTRS